MILWKNVYILYTLYFNIKKKKPILDSLTALYYNGLNFHQK